MADAAAKQAVAPADLLERLATENPVEWEGLVSNYFYIGEPPEELRLFLAKAFEAGALA